MTAEELAELENMDEDELAALEAELEEEEGLLGKREQKKNDNKQVRENLTS